MSFNIKTIAPLLATQKVTQFVPTVRPYFQKSSNNTTRLSWIKPMKPMNALNNSCKGSGGGSFLKDKTVIFVAALGCIGLDTTRELLKRPLKNLIILDRVIKPEVKCELRERAPNTCITFHKYDVTCKIDESRKLLKKIFDEYGKVDILINGAGILDDHAMERTIAINYTGLVNTTTAIMDFWDIRKGGPGGILCNIGSVTGFNAIYQVPVYSGSKAAVVNFTSSLAKLSKITGVTAYTVNPGITRTTLVAKFNSWLDVEPNVAKLLLGPPTQSTQECARSFVQAIEKNKNGGIWKMDLGKLEDIKWRTYWDSGI